MCTQLISNAFRGPEELGWYSALLPILPSFILRYPCFVQRSTSSKVGHICPGVSQSAKPQACGQQAEA
jgi:hypothetical protein